MTKKKKKMAVTMPTPIDDLVKTKAARAGMIVEDMAIDCGRTKRARRQREIERMLKAGKITSRQFHAADAIDKAYCISVSGGSSELSEQVDSSPKPDAAILAQIIRLDRSRLPTVGWTGGEDWVIDWVVIKGNSIWAYDMGDKQVRRTVLSALHSALDKMADALDRAH